jgi:beta-xylosidase
MSLNIRILAKRLSVCLFLLLFIGVNRFAYTQSILSSEKTEGITKKYSGNPIIKDLFTADPAAMIHNDSFFIYTGHDEQVVGKEGYIMKNWYVFSTTDMVNWKNHGACLALSDFSWASANAWAGQCIERDGKFYWYVPIYYDQIPGKKGFAIGVAVSDNPIGPFKDAIGKPLITNDMTTDLINDWDDIDPTVFVDDDGQAYLYWGNSSCKYVKLKQNMIEIDGQIQYVKLKNFTEAPFLNKMNNTYYLSYAAGWPEVIAYATSSSPSGPWVYQKVINDTVNNCTTNHQSIVKYKGQWYFVYHNGALPTGGNFRRSVCIEKLNYNDADGSIDKINQTTQGVPEISTGTSSSNFLKNSDN